MTTPGISAISFTASASSKGLLNSRFTLSEWPPFTGTRTVVAETAMEGSLRIFRVSFTIFISSLV